MVGTLLPIGHGERLQGRAPLVLWAHAAGTVIAATAVGALLTAAGTLASVPARVGAALVAVVAGTYAAREAGLSRLRIPCMARQVRQQRYRRDTKPRLAAFVYGLGLGIGFATHVTVATLPVVAAWALLSPSVAGVVAMATFGLGRALPLFFLGTKTGRDHETLAAVSDRLLVWRPVVHLLNGLALAFVAGFLVTRPSIDLVSGLGGS
jgi:cytochrome c biogenesis protein CcdA